MKRIISRFWYKFIRFTTGMIAYMYLRLKIERKGDIPKDTPALLISNHQSFMDPVFCAQASKRHLCFMARDTLFKGLFGKLIYSLNAIPIRRGESDVAAMKLIIDKLKANHAVCLYPEGTRTEDGRIADIKPGFGLLCRRGKAGVLPMVIEGMHDLWPKGQKYPKSGKVGVKVGRYYTPEEIKEVGIEKFAIQITNEMRAMQNEIRIEIGKEPIEY